MMKLEHAQVLAQPTPQGFTQLDIQQAQPGYIQQAQQGFAPPGQQSQFGYVRQQPQQGAGQWVSLQPPQRGFVPQNFQPVQDGLAQAVQLQQLPQQDFGAQARQFASSYDISQRADVPHTRRGPKNYARSDERLRELICERLIQDLSIDVSDVSVEVQAGRVILEGSVPDRNMKHMP